MGRVPFRGVLSPWFSTQQVLVSVMPGLHCQVEISSSCHLDPKFCMSCTHFQPKNLEALEVLWVILLRNPLNKGPGGCSWVLVAMSSPLWYPLFLSPSAQCCVWNQPVSCLDSFSHLHVNKGLNPHTLSLRSAPPLLPSPTKTKSLSIFFILWIKLLMFKCLISKLLPCAKPSHLVCF